MTPDSEPPPHVLPDDLGPDLLAHVRGELEAERVAAIDALLAASSELRTEHARLAADHAAWAQALAERAPPPRRATLDALLAAVSGEAAERRARAAVAGSPRDDTALDDDVCADAVALALDQLDGDDRQRIERLVGADPRLAHAADVAGRLAAATRTAFASEPRAETWTHLLAAVAEHGPAPVAFDPRFVPLPGRAHRGRLRVLGWLAPLAAAAALVLALLPDEPGSARIGSGRAFVGQSGESGGTWIDVTHGAFDLDYGDVIGAGGAAITFRVACGDDGRAPAAGGPLADGVAEFVLEPGARLERVDAAHFALLDGRVRVTARALSQRLEIRSGTLYAWVTGTRFDVSAVDERLFVIVEEGSVRLGRRGAAPEAVDVHAGEQGMADAQRVVSAPLDGRLNGDAFLTPHAVLRLPDRALEQRGTLALEASLTVGDGGPVTIAAFDPSAPLFLVRLKGPEGREHEIKVQESMLTTPAPVGDAASAPGEGLWRLAADRPYALRLAIPGLDLEPGRWEARLRYMSYRTREAATPWLGAVESAAVPFEVKAR